MTDEELKKVIETGTIKEKAIALCFEFLEEGKEDDEGAALIIASLADHTEKEKKEFSNWVYCYDIYCFMTPYIGLAYSEYCVRGNKVAELLRAIDNYKRESKMLTDILGSISDEDREAALKVIKATQYAEPYYTMITNRREVKVQTKEAEAELYMELDNLKAHFASLKAVIEAFEEWARRKGCKDIQPPYQVFITKDAKSSYANEVPTHSKRALNKRIRRGEHVTDEERAAAVFPDYDEIKPNLKIKKLTRNKIKYQEGLVGDSIRFRTLVSQTKQRIKKEKDNTK